MRKVEYLSDNPLYNDAFFDLHTEGSRASARHAIPRIFEIIRPASVVDVGCGLGQWLAEFRAAGVPDVFGVDGSYVDRGRLQIEPDRFQAHDLSRPLDLGRRFELAMSLEVAEHLPESAAGAFVASLVRLAPVVLFSAAVPNQGGDGHLNEQWPEYWRDKFLEHDYVVADCLRKRIWSDPLIKPWYCQNALFFVDRQRIDDYPRLAETFARHGERPVLSIVHPAQYLDVVGHLLKNLKYAQRTSAKAALRLRELNLIAFPNWTAPVEQIRAQLRQLCTALANHPQAARITLVVDLTNQTQQWLGQLVTEAVGPLFDANGTPRPGTPHVTAIGGQFEREQWEVLLECLQRRVVLPDENLQAIVSSGAIAMPALTLEGLARKELIAPQ